MATATTHDTDADADEYPWDISRMPISPEQAATEAALEALGDASPDQRATVRRVRETLTGDRPSRSITGADWARALQHCHDLVAVTFSSGGWSEISYDVDAAEFIVVGYSALQDIHGNDPHYAESTTRKQIKEVLHGCPRAVTVDEAALLERETGGGE